MSPNDRRDYARSVLSLQCFKRVITHDVTIYCTDPVETILKLISKVIEEHVFQAKHGIVISSLPDKTPDDPLLTP